MYWTMAYLSIYNAAMTRFETFVDAEFAFAITMLVISIETIPKNPTELFHLSKVCLHGLVMDIYWQAHTLPVQLNWQTCLSTLQVALLSWQLFFTHFTGIRWKIRVTWFNWIWEVLLQGRIYQLGYLALNAMLSGVLAKNLTGKAIIAVGFTYIILLVIFTVLWRIRKKYQPEFTSEWWIVCL